LATIALDKNGNLYATDNELNRVQKFDSNGKFLAKFGEKGQINGGVGLAIDTQGNIYVSDKGSILKFDSTGKLLGKWGKFGTGDGEFNYPTSLGIDKQGNIYVADWMNNRVQKYHLR
jgi:DNA-binding beta-propeller fold protein YncE